MFAPFSLGATGRAGFTTMAPGNFAAYNAAQAYLMNLACVSTSTAASDTYNRGARFSSAGALRVSDATAGLPANTIVNQGIAFTNTGQLCYTTAAIGADVNYLDGLAVTSDGRVYATIMDPVLWTRLGIGVTSSSSLVSAWADQSGNANNLLQATGTNQPTLDTDKSILFDGVDNYLQAAFTLNQPCTYCVLLKQVRWVASATVMSGVTAAVALVQAAGSGSPFLNLNAGSGAAANGNLAVGAWGAVTAVFNGASSSLTINVTSTTGNAGANNAGGITLGCSRVLNNFANVAVKELIVFSSALDANQRWRINRYLAQVGGL